MHGTYSSLLKICLTYPNIKLSTGLKIIKSECKHIYKYWE